MCVYVISFHLIAHRRFPTFSPATSEARNGPKLPRRFRHAHATPLPLDFPNAIVMMCTHIHNYHLTLLFFALYNSLLFSFFSNIFCFSRLSILFLSSPKSFHSHFLVVFFFLFSLCVSATFLFMFFVCSFNDQQNQQSGLSGLSELGTPRGGSVRIQHRPPKHPANMSSSNNAGGVAGVITSCSPSSAAAAVETSRFPKLDECAHFHYDVVDLGPLTVRFNSLLCVFRLWLIHDRET